MRKTLILGTLALLISACNIHRQDEGMFTKEELSIINSTDSIMRVLSIANQEDSLILRNKCSSLSKDALLSDSYQKLCSLMVATVSHPSQDGVGIAGPQVGLNRRIVAVQRFDKAGEPFEVYPNISIIWASDSLTPGPEGCLSVPDMRGEVIRSQEIVIEYTDAEVLYKNQEFQMRRDTIRGFTAVIFQHECDHLDGILYIDRL